MAHTDLDWTLADAPEDDTAALSGAEPGGPGRETGRPLRVRLGALRRPALALLLLAVVAAAGMAAFTRLGWRRLQAQVEREVAYDDEQARAGAAALVQAMQAPGNDTWLQVRAAEVSLGLAAPLPAPHLLPTGAPARLVDFTQSGPGVFDATVVRDYMDSAGAVYEFELVQRYRNLGPGLWERLPTEAGLLADTGLWQGQRLSATVPLADLPWLGPILPQVDAALAQACADWQCPPEWRVPLVFSSRLADLLAPQPSQRAAGAAGSYPIAFDLAAAAPHAPEALSLPSPHLAGRPRGAPARQALARALIAQGLGSLADRLAGPTRRRADYFRDALVARAEIRLGLAAPPVLELEPEHFMAPDSLWNVVAQPAEQAGAAELRLRLQALAFLNFALAEQPASGDGALLRALRSAPTLAAWLEAALGGQAAQSAAAWAATVGAELAAEASLPWDQLRGLAYSCDDQASLVRGGQPEPLPLSPGPVGALGLASDALSPDGRYLAFLRWRANHPLELHLHDFTTGSTQLLTSGRNLSILGWSDAGQLFYLEFLPQSDPTNQAPFLMRFDLASGQHEQVLDRPVAGYWDSASQWSPDRDLLSLTLLMPAPSDLIQLAPALLPARDPGAFELVTPAGHSPAFSPDGTKLAYVATPEGVGGMLDFGTSIELYDLATGTRTEVVSRNALSSGGRAPNSISFLTWAPDGSALAFVVYDQPIGAQLQVVTLADGRVRAMPTARDVDRTFPLGFSPDSRYLAYYAFSGSFTAGDRLTVADWRAAAPAQTQTFPVQATGAVWAPQGHLLAARSPGGVYAVDPADGRTRWLQFGACSRPAWYRLPERS